MLEVAYESTSPDVQDKNYDIVDPTFACFVAC